MLCLTRAPGERFRLSIDGTVVWVIFNGRTGTGEAKLLVDAPASVRVHREELLPDAERTGRCPLPTHGSLDHALRAERAGEGLGPPAYCDVCNAYHLARRRRTTA